MRKPAKTALTDALTAINNSAITLLAASTATKVSYMILPLANASYPATRQPCITMTPKDVKAVQAESTMTPLSRNVTLALSRIVTPASRTRQRF